MDKVAVFMTEAVKAKFSGKIFLGNGRAVQSRTDLYLNEQALRLGRNLYSLKMFI